MLPGEQFQAKAFLRKNKAKGPPVSEGAGKPKRGTVLRTESDLAEHLKELRAPKVKEEPVLPKQASSPVISPTEMRKLRCFFWVVTLFPQNWRSQGHFDN